MVLPDSHRAPRTPCYSGARSARSPGFSVRGCHALWPPVRRVVPLSLRFLALRRSLSPPGAESHDPSCATPTGLTRTRFRLFPLRSPLLGESLACFLFLRVLRWFTSPGWLVAAYCIQQHVTADHAVGFPHWEIDGSRDVCSSPSLIAAYHVLHRLHAPRHPPCALCSLPNN